MKKLMCILMFSAMLIFTACTDSNSILKASAKEHITSYIYNTETYESIVASEVIIGEIIPTDPDIWLISGTVSIITTENSTSNDFSFRFIAEKNIDNEYSFRDTEIYSIN